MRRKLRFSPAAQLVLERFVVGPSRWHHGYALMLDLELPSGTLYPVLMRLADSGWLETRWEATAHEGRPPRHMYRLEGGAASDARALLEEWATRWVKHRVPRAVT